MKLNKIFEEKKEKEKKLYVDSDPHKAFPQNTFSALKSEVKKLSKDISKDWGSPLDIVSAAFKEKQIDIPYAYQKERWDQYKELLSIAVDSLINSKGIDSI